MDELATAALQSKYEIEIDATAISPSIVPKQWLSIPRLRRLRVVGRLNFMTTDGQQGANEHMIDGTLVTVTSHATLDSIKCVIHSPDLNQKT